MSRAGGEFRARQSGRGSARDRVCSSSVARRFVRGTHHRRAHPGTLEASSRHSCRAAPRGFRSRRPRSVRAGCSTNGAPPPLRLRSFCKCPQVSKFSPRPRRSRFGDRRQREGRAAGARGARGRREEQMGGLWAFRPQRYPLLPRYLFRLEVLAR